MTQVRSALDRLVTARGRLLTHGALVAFASVCEAWFWLARRWRLGLAVAVTAGAVAALYFGTRGTDPTAPADAVVRIAPGGTGSLLTSAGTGVGRAPGSPAPLNGQALTRALQSGLARAECYDGPVNGFWTARTKQAMGRFVAAINAKLPVEAPDQILLALVESHQGPVCSGGQIAVGTPTAAAVSAAAALAAVRPPRAEPATPPPETKADSATRPANGPAPVPADSPRLPAAVAPPVRAERGPSLAAATPPPPPAETAAREQPGEAASPSVRGSKAEQRRVRRHQSKQNFETVAKSMSKGFKSLQRSIASIFK